jgi:hypothetical protein
MGNVLQQVLLLLLFSFLNQTKSDDDPGLCRSSGLGSNFTKTQQMCMMPIRMDPIMGLQICREQALLLLIVLPHFNPKPLKSM